MSAADRIHALVAEEGRRRRAATRVERDAVAERGVTVLGGSNACTRCRRAPWARGDAASCVRWSQRNRSKGPPLIEFMPSLPKSAVGKAPRRELREMESKKQK